MILLRFFGFLREVDFYTDCSSSKSLEIEFFPPNS